MSDIKIFFWLLSRALCFGGALLGLTMAADLVKDIEHVKGVIGNTGGTSSPQLAQAQDLLDQAIASEEEAGDEVKAQELIDQAKALLGMK